jgi:hypothetical protein
MNQVKYRVVKPNEVPELAIIEKSNISVEIKLGDTLSNLEYNRKQMESLESEIKLKEALVKNVEVNHPKILKIDEKTQLICHTYYEANRFVTLGKEKLKEFKEAQKELQKEVDEIKAQTGLEKISVIETLKVVDSINKKKSKK